MNWQQLNLAPLDSIIDWAETQWWTREMASCQQDSAWHGEGDVWTHTKMVVTELTRLDEWSTLDTRDQTILLFTALLHDVAKPRSTQIDPETGRVTSPKHAVRGEHVARGILRELGCELLIREEIAKLVRFHGRPAFLLERENPTHEVVRLSWLVSNRLLYLFSLADSRGRDSDTATRPEENLHYWKLVSEESGCFDSPFPFANDEARFLFSRSSNPNLHYVPHEEYSCTVTLMSGLPGSGKDHWLSKHRRDRPVVSLDSIRQTLDVAPTDNQGVVVQQAQERCREFLRRKVSFAFNATNSVRQTRARWISLFADYNARIEIVYVEPKFDDILKQNQGRIDPVPTEIIEKLASKYEPPTWLDCHQLIIAGND